MHKLGWARSMRPSNLALESCALWSTGQQTFQHLWIIYRHLAIFRVVALISDRIFNSLILFLSETTWDIKMMHNEDPTWNNFSNISQNFIFQIFKPVRSCVHHGFSSEINTNIPNVKFWIIFDPFVETFGFLRILRLNSGSIHLQNFGSISPKFPIFSHHQSSCPK